MSFRGQVGFAVVGGGAPVVLPVLPWTEVLGTSQACAIDNGYIANNAARVVFTLPATSVVGNVIRIAGKGAGGWRVTGKQIQFGYWDLLWHTWITANPLNTARQSLAGCGTQDAGLSFGGFNGGVLGTTEEYNGAVWATGSDLNTARHYLAGCGTQNAGLSFGGITLVAYQTVTEEYDGISWSAGGNLNTARYGLAGCGTQDAGLSFGGDDGVGNASAVTEEYDGAAWAVGGNLNTARYVLAGCGTQDAGLSFGGRDNALVLSAVTEEYNGATWATSGNLNTARQSLAGCGTQDTGLSFGGYTGVATAVTEEYDGAWVVGGNLNTARHLLAGAGSQSLGLSFGGYDVGYLAVSEEYLVANLQSTDKEDAIELLCITANTTWEVIDVVGNIEICKATEIYFTILFTEDFEHSSWWGEWMSPTILLFTEDFEGVW